jgi:dTMP kinase
MPLIVFEGIDGCGKTTQADLLCARFDTERIAYRRLREPGGTVLGEANRRILLDPATKACPIAELFGYLQARAQLCDEVLRPALAVGELVLLDRFWYSTISYQAWGLGLEPNLVIAANRLAIGDLVTDLALWFDVEPAEAAKRRAAHAPDRIESRGVAYLGRVRAGYDALSASGELRRIDAERPVAVIAAEVWELVSALLCE